MKELKTLKDFERDKTDLAFAGIIGPEDKLISIKELRAEAVNWIKKMREDKNAERLKYYSYFVRLNLSETEAEKGMKLTIDWIKCFFNLTEEDLK